MSEYVVCRQGTPDTLERELANRLDCDGILDCHEHTGTDKDLTGLCFVAKPRGDIGYRPDRGIVETSFKADCAERRKAVRDTNAEANIVAQSTPLLGQRSDGVPHFKRRQHRLESRVINRDWIVKDHHHPVTSVAFKRAAVLDDDLANRSMIVAQQRHHVFCVRAFGKPCENRAGHRRVR